MVLTLLLCQRAFALLDLDRLDEAERDGRLAFARMPWLDLVKLVYGSFLVASGSLAGGVEQLKRVHGPYDQFANAWLAIAFAQLGKTADARAALEAATKDHMVQPRLRKRAEAAVAALPTAAPTRA